ncbi:hypothetical protein D1646_16865 [Pseudoflavonifractor sp. 60]|uniref:hypothetical protein n=1 Tax=Pseudoflavonifractor sp. 60 TaxID=2304576 RepID=UPI00136E446E|nr:hypothetical protein [Pseudoflavonifractor sp. 60]NBI68437.1 hypothetical protein [Pseudoflavonifractor sp. 60]
MSELFYFLLGLALLPGLLALLSAPFCLLQLALCERRRYQLAPALLSLFGLVWCAAFSYSTAGPQSLLVIPVFFPACLNLLGNGLGWLLWHRRNKGGPP